MALEDERVQPIEMDDGRKATAVYLDSFDGEVVPREEARVMVLRFEDGEVMHLSLADEEGGTDADS